MRISKGKVYIITNDTNNKVYIGSTLRPLNKRFQQHLSCNTYIKDNPNINFYIQLIKEYNVVSEYDTIDKRIKSNHLRAYEQLWINKFKMDKNVCLFNSIDAHTFRNWKSICEHNKRRYDCKECKGTGICEHNKRKSVCKECKGTGICEHNKQRSQCKDCRGGNICEHNKRRSQCKECKGTSICIHNKQRNLCKECNPVKCELCGITTSKASYPRHTKSKKHIQNQLSKS